MYKGWFTGIIWNMKFKSKIVLLLCFFVGTVCAFSEKITLSASDAVRYALENNITVKENKINLDSAAREKNFSWNGISPSASLSANYSRDVPSKENSHDTISAGVRISASLTPSLYTQIKNAALAYQAQEITFENAKNTISSSVLKNYYAILYEVENLELSRKNLETKKKQYDANLEKFNRGMLNQVDVLSAQIAWQNMELTVETQKINLENSLAQFRQSLGLSQETEIEFSNNFERFFSFNKIDADKITVKSSEIELLEKQLESAKNTLLANRLKTYGPSISASYNYSENYAADGFEKLSDGGSVSAGVSIPLDGIMPWSSSAQGIDSAKENIRLLELKLEDQKTTVRIKADSLIKKINQCVENIKVRKSSIELAETNYAMTLKAYNYGTRDLLTLQAAQDNLLESKVNLISEANTLVACLCDLINISDIGFENITGEVNE